MRYSPSWIGVVVLFVGAVLCLSPDAAHAYIGPGAGFALISSFLTFLIAFLTAFLALFTYPVRRLWRLFKRKQRGPARVDKVIMLGLDGLEPTICEEMMARGELPNMTKLKETGAYRRLGTANPAMSPVAWSTFATGSDASRHGIFDFLARDAKTYMPVLSSSRVAGGTKFWKLGPFRIPHSKGSVKLLRHSQSFWKILGDYGVFSTVLRVPITFPPEKLNGVLLAGMCVPDLRGTQGTFTYYTQSESEVEIGGMVIKLAKNGNPIRTTLPGPPHPDNGQPMELPVEISVAQDKKGANIQVGKESFFLEEREYSPWIRLPFKAARNMILYGIARFYITRLDGEFGMYVTPIHIDPDKPAMPISYPSYYATYLAKLHGTYGTLGLAEDTWALNERVLDEDAFLKQAYLYHEEREKMWFHALGKLRKGLVCCVFDLSDRLQHMCFRYLDQDHPANRGKDTEKHKDALYDMYRKMDELVGETMKSVDDRTALFVMSDHGFKPFKWGVNLNTWLEKEGYLVYKDGEARGEFLQGVDWTKTRAYGVGLGGIFLNIKGRERQGIVERAGAAALKQEITQGLMLLKDDENGGAAVMSSVYDVAKEFSGPYRTDGPDLLAGFAVGYRVSWDCARGVVTPDVIEDNTKSWSGDHCIDPKVVPGILYTNLKLSEENPRLMDLGPTTLDLFGVPIPGYMNGKSII